MGNLASERSVIESPGGPSQSPGHSRARGNCVPHAWVLLVVMWETVYRRTGTVEMGDAQATILVNPSVEFRRRHHGNHSGNRRSRRTWRLRRIARIRCRDIAGLRAKPDDTVLMYDDPNSTMGVTRDVLAEKLEQLQPESRAYSQNWSKA